MQSSTLPPSSGCNVHVFRKNLFEVVSRHEGRWEAPVIACAEASTVDDLSAGQWAMLLDRMTRALADVDSPAKLLETAVHAV